MRRICLILVAGALSMPGLAFALPSAEGDGSLGVTGGNGTLTVSGHGVIFGYFDQGTLLVLSYRPDDPSATMSVAGASARPDAVVATYSGTGVRFLLPAGHYTLELIATGIDLSAVGRGTVEAYALNPFPAGELVLDGGKPISFAGVVSPLSFGKDS